MPSTSFQSHPSVRAAVRARAVRPLAMLLLVAGAGAAMAAPCDVPLSNVQRRIVAEASQGDAALLRFVQRTKPVYQLDAADTVRWLDAESRRRTTCLAALGSGRDGAPPSGAMPGAPARP